MNRPTPPHSRSSLRLTITTASLILLLLPHHTVRAQARTTTGDWPQYGGDLAGQRFSNARQVDTRNVAQLQPAWTMSFPGTSGSIAKNIGSVFEATPVLWNDTLYVDSAYDAVYAIDASTGLRTWTFDPGVSRQQNSNLTSRGVVLWHAASAPASRRRTSPCSAAIVFVATLDRRLIALDALTGTPCPGFGNHGTVDLTQGLAIGPETGYLSYTSPPLILGDTIILGSCVADNLITFAASGAIRGFDLHTGRQKWSWEPLRSVDTPHLQDLHLPRAVGSGNAWAPLSADPAHDLVFVPTGSPSVDFYGGTRLGDNRDADSLVALRASTGQRVWAFQLLHHDIWDYDAASQPVLFTFRKKIPAVAITTKTGMVFVFNRLTGEPLYPIEERPVPASTLPGETASPTQPFSSLPPLAPLSFTAADVHLHDAAGQRACQDLLRAVDNHGIFTPPSSTGALDYPGNTGGVNWGSAAIDPASAILYTRVSVQPFVVQELPRSPPTRWQRFLNAIKRWLHLGDPAAPRPVEIFHIPDSGADQRSDYLQQGTPYNLVRKVLVAPDGTPCAPAPFGSIVALDLNSGRKLWSVAHGRMVKTEAGSVGAGGVIVTAGGLVFAASTNDPFFRAYAAADGALLWQTPLPAVAQATPMTYISHGRQFIVIAAGGYITKWSHAENSLIAFALPGPASTPAAAPKRRP